MLRLRELSDLTMSEIHESYSWLKSEFSDLEREAKNLKRMPAWGFAKRKTYEPLTKKILRDFDREIDIIKDESREFRWSTSFLNLSITPVLTTKGLVLDRDRAGLAGSGEGGTPAARPSGFSFRGVRIICRLMRELGV